MHRRRTAGGPDGRPHGRERARAEGAADQFQAEETGYQQIQGTKPQTLGIALNDSPAGLAAWIVEKFRTWCDCDGNPETVFTKDELLDQHHALLGHADGRVVGAHLLREPPRDASAAGVRPHRRADGLRRFPKEIIWSPRRWLEPRYDIIRWTEMPKAATSPHSSSRNYWLTTSARSLPVCAGLDNTNCTRLPGS